MRRKEGKEERRKEGKEEMRKGGKCQMKLPVFLREETKLDTYCSCSSSREVDAAVTFADAEEEVGSMTDAAVSSI